jgi:DNA polymerase
MRRTRFPDFLIPGGGAYVRNQEPNVSSTLWIDIETRSRVNLKKTGVYRYVRCPDFKILMASWILDDGPTITAQSDAEIYEIPGLWDPSVRKVAHNAAFERVCFSEFAGRLGLDLPTRYLPPEEWDDTMAIGAEQGFPKSLADMAKRLEATPKDEAGAALINWFCKPAPNGEFRRPEDHPEKWAQFVAYCEQDTETLKELDLLLAERGGWPTETERQIYLVDQAINDRGIGIDLDLARAAARAGVHATEEQKERVRELTLWEVENPGSIPQMHKWFTSQDFTLPDLKAETVERALLRPDLTPVVQEVLELRQDLALAAPAKFGAALEAQVDGRLHGTLSFFGAHTGRWAGRGTQPQNLPRASHKPSDEDAATLEAMADLGLPKADLEAFEREAVDRATEAEIERIKAGERVSALTLKKSVRPMFTIDGVVVDYAAIEARVISWLAGEEWALQAFREKRDIYVETAGRMGGLTRAQGKIAVLALGYNGGAGSLKAMATDRDFIEVNGEPMLLANVPDEILYERFVWPWREANSRIVRLWKLLENRFRTGGQVGDLLEFEKDRGNRDRLLRLPSGRFIAYRDCGTQTRRKFNKRTNEWEKKQVLTFWSSAGYRADTYGGRLAENATQAVARDLMAEALVRLERAGLEVVAHIHDEIVVQGTKDVDLVSEIMCELPPWAEGLPVDGEGFATYRYKKG